MYNIALTQTAKKQHGTTTFYLVKMLRKGLSYDGIPVNIIVVNL